MREHAHIMREDMRGPLQPVDQLSHISRINDWIGSDSWVQGCRADRPFGDERMSDYPEPKLPYKLIGPATDERGIRRKPGEIVYVEPSKRGIHHAKIPGQEYPDLPEPLPSGTDLAPRLVDNEARMARMEERVAVLEQALAALHGGLMTSASAKVQQAVADVKLPDAPSNDG